MYYGLDRLKESLKDHLQDTNESTTKLNNIVRASLINSDANSIKNYNDVFGYIKKSEVGLTKIANLFDTTTNLAELNSKIKEIVDSANYKNENVFACFKLDLEDAKEDIKSKMELMIEENNPKELKSFVQEKLEVAKKLVDEVKAVLLNTSNSISQKSTTKSAVEQDMANFSADFMKDKFKSLLN